MIRRPRGATVEVAAVGKRFAGPPVVDALRHCSFSIEGGSYVAVTGRSGSGKSTLMSVLGLLEVPSSGTYRLDGADVAHLTDRRRSAVRAHLIGFVFQTFHLVRYRSVSENIQMGLMYRGVERRQRRSLTASMVDRLGLGDRADAVCATLSGGEQQRVAIGRALVGTPSLVLCDEPTGNLDSAASNDVLDLVDELHHDGVTIVMITHDVSVAARADRRLHIADGVMTEATVDRR
jgi:putative ABC transport system ATP-binding protein